MIEIELSKVGHKSSWLTPGTKVYITVDKDGDVYIWNCLPEPDNEEWLFAGRGPQEKLSNLNTTPIKVDNWDKVVLDGVIIADD